MDNVSITLPARSEFVGVVRSVVTKLGNHLSWSEDAIDDMRLAMTEASTYLLKVGEGASELRLVMTQIEGSIEAALSVDIPISRLPEEGEEQFLSWHLLGALTDETKIEWGSDGLVLRFIKVPDGRRRSLGLAFAHRG